MGWASTEDRAVPQALEKLRLDMEEVFDRHRELYGGKPPTTPTQSQSPRRCTVSAREVGAKTLPRPSLGPHEGKRAAQPQLAGLRRPPVSSSQPQSPAPQPQSPVSPVPSPSASAPTSPLRHSVRREISARLRNNTFDITESENNWMHSLLKMESTSRMSMSSRRALGAAVARVSAAAPTCVQRFVRRPAYELAQVLVIFLDAVLVVWEMQHAAQGAAPSAHLGAGGIADAPLFTVLLDISCACVLVDQLLRLAGGKFDQTLGAFWQSFHLLVAATQLLQAIGHHSHLHQRSSSQFRVGLAMLSTLRIGRVLSLVLVSRVIRQHRFFRELRIMVHALAGVVKVLLWSSLLIFTILLMFGTVLSEGTLALLVRSGPGSAPPSLQERFGSLFAAVLTLFQSMSGGVDWEQVWLDLGALGWSYRGVYLLFICFSLTVLLNVVTAVFIESTMARSMNDRGLVVQNEVMEKRDFLTSMRKIFRELDGDVDGEITMEEMQRRMLDPEIGAYFSQLGMDPDQVGKLFFLLDRDKSGTLDPEEFMFGCLKFRGDAKSLDIAVMHQQVKWVHDTLKAVVTHLGIDSEPDQDFPPSRVFEGNTRNSVFSAAPSARPSEVHGGGLMILPSQIERVLE